MSGYDRPSINEVSRKGLTNSCVQKGIEIYGQFAGDKKWLWEVAQAGAGSLSQELQNVESFSRAVWLAS